MDKLTGILGTLMTLAAILFMVAIVIVLFIIIVCIVIGAKKALSEKIGGNRSGRHERDV